MSRCTTCTLVRPHSECKFTQYHENPMRTSVTLHYWKGDRHVKNSLLIKNPNNSLLTDQKKYDIAVSLETEIDNLFNSGVL